MHREREFLTQVGGSLRERGAFYFKIPDMPHFEGAKFRFDLKKPFDAFATYQGVPIAIEAKVITGFQKIGFRQFRPNQIDGLNDWVNAGGRAFIFLNIRRQGRPMKMQSKINRLCIFDWKEFRDKGGYSKNELVLYPHLERYRSQRDTYRFNLDEFLLSLVIPV